MSLSRIDEIARHCAPGWFALSWPAFTVPAGACVAASLRLGVVPELFVTYALRVAAWCLLLVLWSVTLLNTLRGVASGAVFRPHP